MTDILFKFTGKNLMLEKGKIIQNGSKMKSHSNLMRLQITRNSQPGYCFFHKKDWLKHEHGRFSLTLPISTFKKVQLLSSKLGLTEFFFGLLC